MFTTKSYMLHAPFKTIKKVDYEQNNISDRKNPMVLDKSDNLRRQIGLHVQSHRVHLQYHQSIGSKMLVQQTRRNTAGHSTTRSGCQLMVPHLKR